MKKPYNIGLDFGTTNSIISYLKNGTPTVFKYGAPGHQEEYIPSFIAYDDVVEIGTTARNIATKNPKIDSYGNFKMQLPMKETEINHNFPSVHNPITITTDYLKELLLSPDNEYNFSQQKGEIAGIVVSVPEIWQRDIYNLGRERLQKIIEDLQLPLVRLISEPVAAAAYYAWLTQKQTSENQAQPFQGNLLVCDMGGGTFDVSLCHIYGENKVEVLYFDGEGDQGLESAGVAFDRRCVQIAYFKNKGNHLDENECKFIQLLRQFETEKIISHTKSTKSLNNVLKDDSIATKDIYTFSFGDDTLTLNGAEILEAFEPIKEGIEKVMQRVNNWLTQNNQTFDRVVLVGGFSRFILVQKAICDALNIQFSLKKGEQDPRFDDSFNLTKSAYAISYGACLIANGIVDPTEKYIHTLGIYINRQVKVPTIRGIQIEIEEEKITLIQGGVSLDKLQQPNFHNQPLAAWQESFAVPIWVDPKTRGQIYKKYTPESVKLPNYSSDAKYRVGMRVDVSQVAYLVIEETNSKQRLEYKLGEIISQLFPGGFFEPDESS